MGENDLCKKFLKTSGLYQPTIQINQILMLPCIENFGESELREALLRKSEHFAIIGDKKSAIEVNHKSEGNKDKLHVHRSKVMDK